MPNVKFDNMGHTVCFANNKGGVGKTTTAAYIGYAWAKMGKKVLFIDLDSQANLTAIVGTLKPGEREMTIRDAFLDKKDLYIEKVNDFIDLIPSDLSLSNFDRDTAAVTGREYLLADILHKIRNNYDFVIIDCPPALGLITYNALIASQHLVMVSTADGLSYSGMAMIANLYSDIRGNARLNPSLKLTGVVITRYERNRLSDMYIQKIREELREALIEPFVPKATKISQAGSFGQNIFDYDPEGKATKAYLEIAQKLAIRMMSDN